MKSKTENYSSVESCTNEGARIHGRLCSSAVFGPFT